MELAPGLTDSQSVTVTEDMTPIHLCGDAIRVLATPEMVRLVEQTAIQCVQPCLKPGQTTVGTVVNVKHLAATPGGITVPITAALMEVEGRLLVFGFEVHDDTETVGEGGARAVYHRPRIATAAPPAEGRRVEDEAGPLTPAAA
jgi:fluoroacetyl-CoA thioesterase